MKKLVPVLLAAAMTATPLAAQHEDHGRAAGEPADTTPPHGATAPLGVPQTRGGSGTSWLPDASPMYAVHRRSGEWELMLHGNVFLQYIRQGSERGEGQLGSINWLMGMARRQVWDGELGLRAMVSAEPFTIPGCGYPILLATGELCDGEPIHDAQHPHDLIMELAVQYERELTDGVALALYGGPAGEPALGPAAFPHRVSALANPLAPISHHWFDATHIAFGVVTGGVYGRQWKLEGSVFNGREPDEERTGLDLAPLDSYSGRAWWLPSERWALQVSAGRLTEAEPGHHEGDPRIDVDRYTASASYHHPLGGGGFWAGTAAVGRNVEEGEGTNAALAEATWRLDDLNTLFGRAEWTEKAGHDLDLDHELEEEVFSVSQLSLGYVRQLGTVRGWMPGVGVRGSVSFLPADLEPYYGERTPLGFAVFASLRPAPMRMGAEHGATQAPMPMEHKHDHPTR